MFGSLVITFPTKHEGGALAVHHGGNQWVIDSGKLLAEQRKPCVVYAAFYSDVEHEVLPVQSGHRVTVTYNLYFDKHEPFFVTVGSAIFPHPTSLETTFTEFLADPTFFPEGGCLGFALHHQYPLSTSPVREDVTEDDSTDEFEAEYPDQGKGKYRNAAKRAELRALEDYLKGGDALLKQVCDKLDLRSYLGIVYKDDEYEWLCDQVVDLDTDQTVRMGSLEEYLERGYDAEMLEGPNNYNGRYVWWVTHSPRANAYKVRYQTYGNEPTMSLAYFRVCLFVEVGALGSR